MKLKLRKEESNLTLFIRKFIKSRKGWVCVCMARSYQKELNKEVL